MAQSRIAIAACINHLELIKNFYVIGWKQAICAIWSKTLPPSFIDLINMCDNVARIECNLRFIIWNSRRKPKRRRKKINSLHRCDETMESYRLDSRRVHEHAFHVRSLYSHKSYPQRRLHLYLHRWIKECIKIRLQRLNERQRLHIPVGKSSRSRFLSVNGIAVDLPLDSCMSFAATISVWSTSFCAIAWVALAVFVYGDRLIVEYWSLSSSSCCNPINEWNVHGSTIIK